MITKKNTFYTVMIVVPLVLLSVSYPLRDNDESVYNENFFVFFKDFCSNAPYQKTRIIFPLKDVYLSEDLNNREEDLITEDEWSFLRIKQFKTNTVEQYFNNFNKKRLEDSDEMVFVVGGIENGIYMSYYFSRKEGKWYLVKMEDLTT